MDPKAKKHTMGRRKIEIKKIEEKSSRQVTFSKRRTGLFKKASELCILSGAEAAIFVVSPKGKIFTFGHPSVEAIICRYMQGNNHNLEGSENYFQSLGGPFCEFGEIMEQLRVLEAERDRLKEMNSHMMMPKDVYSGRGRNENWWDRKIDGMGLEELQKFRESLEELKKRVELKAEENGMRIQMSAQISGEMGEEDVDSKALIIVPHHDDYAFEFHNIDV